MLHVRVGGGVISR